MRSDQFSDYRQILCRDQRLIVDDDDIGKFPELYSFTERGSIEVRELHDIRAPRRIDKGKGARHEKVEPGSIFAHPEGIFERRVCFAEARILKEALAPAGINCKVCRFLLM